MPPPSFLLGLRTGAALARRHGRGLLTRPRAPLSTAAHTGRLSLARVACAGGCSGLGLALLSSDNSPFSQSLFGRCVAACESSLLGAPTPVLSLKRTLSHDAATLARNERRSRKKDNTSLRSIVLRAIKSCARAAHFRTN